VVAELVSGVLEGSVKSPVIAARDISKVYRMGSVAVHALRGVSLTVEHGNLDSRASEEIMAIFQRLNYELGITIVFVTHEPDIAAHTQRIIHLHDGELSSDERNLVPRLAYRPSDNGRPA